MITFFKMMTNWWTTLGGIFVGVGQYITTGPGARLPTNKAEWGQFVLGLAIVLWGLVMKDATTGSTPK